MLLRWGPAGSCSGEVGAEVMLIQGSWGRNARAGCAGHRTVTAHIPREWPVHFAPRVNIAESGRKVRRSRPM